MARQDWFYDLAVLEGPRPRTPGVWGGIQGDIAGQTDLQAALALKSDDATVQAALALKANVAQTVEAFTFTTKQNDLAVASGTTILRWNGAGATGITGIAAPSTARVVTVVNASTDYLLWLENENTASAAANRLMLPDAFPAFLMPGDTITLFYDLTTARWRVLSWPTRGMGMGLAEWQDQIATHTPLGTAAGTGSGSFGATSTGVNTTERVDGAFQITTGTTTTGSASIGWVNGTTSNVVPTFGARLVVVRIAFPTATDGTETFAVRSGYYDTPVVTDGVYAEYDWSGSAPRVALCTTAGGVVTRNTTNAPSVPAAGEFFWSALFINPEWTRADLVWSADSVNYALTCSSATGFPSSAQLTGLIYAGIIKSAGTTARTLAIDGYGHRVQQVRA